MADFYLNKLRQQQHGGADEPVTASDPWGGMYYFLISLGLLFVVMAVSLYFTYDTKSFLSKAIDKLGKDLRPSADLTSKMRDFFLTPPPLSRG